jgi:hypothetical protein
MCRSLAQPHIQEYRKLVPPIEGAEPSPAEQCDIEMTMVMKFQCVVSAEHSAVDVVRTQATTCNTIASESGGALNQLNQ